MLLFKLISFLLGYVIISVIGDVPERFVNMSASRGIYLWDIIKTGDGAICLKVRLSAVKSLRHIARRTRCRFRIRGRRGLPFYFNRLRRRKVLTLGAVIFLGVLYFLSSFVWFLEVRGNRQVNAAEVLEAAREAGLSRGIPKWKIEAGKVEAKIEERLPLVTWAGVYIKGTKVTIEVAERTLPEGEDRRPSHIVAAKAGLIKELLILSGHPAVKEGDTVAPGQVLISGAIPPPEEPPGKGEEKKPGEVPKAVRPSRYVHAKGIVRAHVWYEGYGEAKLLEAGSRLTGRCESRASIKFKGKEIILSGNQNISFEHYQTETFVKRVPEWRNLSIPVELVTVKYLELVEFQEERSREEALRVAGEWALDAVTKLLPKDAVVQGRWSEEVPEGKSGNLVRVKAVLETIEDIGSEKLFNSEQAMIPGP